MARWSSCQVDRSSHLIHVWCRFDARMLLNLWPHNRNLAYLLTKSVKCKSRSWKSARVHCVIGANIGHWLFLIHLGFLFPCFVKIPDIQCRQNTFTLYLVFILAEKNHQDRIQRTRRQLYQLPFAYGLMMCLTTAGLLNICSCSSYLVFPPVAS